MKYKVEIFKELGDNLRVTQFEFSFKEDAEDFVVRYNTASAEFGWDTFAGGVDEIYRITVNCWVVEVVADHQDDSMRRYVEDVEYFDNKGVARTWVDDYNRNSAALNSPDFIRIAEIV